MSTAAFADLGVSDAVAGVLARRGFTQPFTIQSLVIGDILGISGNTVDAHLRRIYLKLGVFYRLSAAVRGIGVGLIHAGT